MAKKKDEQKRVDLFEASIKVLSSKNFHEISVEDIIKKAGVGKSTFYSTYKTKEIWYDQIRSDVSEMYWESLIRHYVKMKDKTFSEKMRHLAVYLMLYTRRSVDYRRVTKGQMMWRSKFKEMQEPKSEEQKLFSKDLNDYAMKMKIDPEEARMNVHMLLTSAVRYGYAAAEQKINVPFSTIKENVSYVAGQLFPEE